MTNDPSLSLRSLLDNENLKNEIFIIDWHRCLRSVLRQEENEYILTKSLFEKSCDKIRQSEIYMITKSLVRCKMSEKMSP
jgi:hypothetical protein